MSCQGQRTLRRIAAVAAAMGAATGALGLIEGGIRGAAAAVSAGSAEIVDPVAGTPLLSGGSDTGFRLKLPSGAACTGDSSKDGYRIQSYLVPRSVAVDTLRFDPGVGPQAVAGEFRAPLFEISTTPYVDQQTAEAPVAAGPGPIIQPLPSFSFGVYDTTTFPFTPGVYSVGIACTLGPPGSPTQLDRYWNAAMTITADPADPGPAKIRWTATAAAPATTTTLTVGPSTTAAFTSATGSSTTTTVGTSTSTTSTTSSTSPTGGADPGSGSTVGTDTGTTSQSASPAGQLPKSGRSFLLPLLWSFLLLCTGRALVLLGRRPSLPPSER